MTLQSQGMGIDEKVGQTTLIGRFPLLVFALEGEMSGKYGLMVKMLTTKLGGVSRLY